MLKLRRLDEKINFIYPAAFGRLCVETQAAAEAEAMERQPPSGGCVLKRLMNKLQTAQPIQPPSGGCVLKRLLTSTTGQFITTSRLRAAVC